jgi:hypothetical protein
LATWQLLSWQTLQAPTVTQLKIGSQMKFNLYSQQIVPVWLRLRFSDATSQSKEAKEFIGVSPSFQKPVLYDRSNGFQFDLSIGRPILATECFSLQSGKGILANKSHPCGANITKR